MKKTAGLIPFKKTSAPKGPENEKAGQWPDHYLTKLRAKHKMKYIFCAGGTQKMYDGPSKRGLRTQASLPTYIDMHQSTQPTRTVPPVEEGNCSLTKERGFCSMNFRRALHQRNLVSWKKGGDLSAI